jgi:hypothetical protein
MCDSTSAISVAKNPVLHSKTKDIEVKYHLLIHNVEKGNIDLIQVPKKAACRYPNQDFGPSYICAFARRSWSHFSFLSFGWEG